MKWATQAMEEEKNKPQTFSADGWTGESKIFTNVVKKWARTFLSLAKNRKNKWAEWLGRGEREGDKGAKAFCPGWRHQPGQKSPLLSRFVPPTGTKGLAPLIPFPLPHARAIQLTCFLCSWLGIEEFLLISSPHLWKIFDSPSIHLL